MDQHQSMVEPASYDRFHYVAANQAAVGMGLCRELFGEADKPLTYTVTPIMARKLEFQITLLN